MRRVPLVVQIPLDLIRRRHQRGRPSVESVSTVTVGMSDHSRFA
jgi:hypothetical protein